MKRIAVKLVIFLLLGAVVNVGLSSVALPQEDTSHEIATEPTSRGPDRIITFGPKSRIMGAFVSTPQGHTGYVSVQREAINIWFVLTYYWPEDLIVVFVLAGSIWLWRLLRRRRIPGEPYCRRCNYRLTGGVATEKCPECGTAFADRSCVIGKRIRFKLTAAIVLSSILPGALLCGIWSQLLPRQAAVSDWVAWWSISLHEYADEHNLRWLTAHARHVRVILEVDAATGETIRVVHVSPGEPLLYLLIDSDGSDLYAVSFTSRPIAGEAPAFQVVQIDAASGRVRCLIPIEEAEVVGYADDTQTLYTLSRAQEQLSAVTCSTGEVAQLLKINYNRQPLRSGSTVNPPMVLTVPPANRRLVVAEYEHDVRMTDARSRVTYQHAAYKVTLWDARSQSTVASLGESIPIGAMAASGDGKRLFAAVYGKGIQAWDLERHEQPPLLVTEDTPAHILDKITISPDGRYLFARERNLMARTQSIHVFDLVLLAWVDERAVPGGATVRNLFVSADGEFLVADCSLQGGRGRELAVYDLGDLAPVTSPPAEGADRR